MVKNGIPPKIAAEIWELFPAFARYGFNKSHAACYAMIGYQTAYLKANYPEEFTAARAQRGNERHRADLVPHPGSKAAGVKSCRRTSTAASSTSRRKGAKIRFGLLAIKNVGSEVTRAIIEERARGGPYKNFENFLIAHPTQGSQ